MPSLTDAPVAALLEAPHHAVISTLNEDGSIRSAVAWISLESRGTATGTREDADDHIDRLSKQYIGQDEYPFRGPGEVRRKYVITPERIRYQKQG
jgi:hypothetical protein